MTLRLYETREDLPGVTSYEWQTFIQCRLEPWPAPRCNVATVGKVRGAERYTVLPALQFAETYGHGHTFDTMREVRAHLRQAIKDSPSQVI